MDEEYYKYFELDEWNLLDACYLVMGFNPQDRKDPRYNKKAADLQHHFFETISLYKNNINEFTFDQKKEFVLPEQFIEWAHSEGFTLEGCWISDDGNMANPLCDLAEQRLARSLTRYEFGRYKQFYVKWLNKGYWTSTEAINLLCNKDPQHDYSHTKGFADGVPAINGGYNKDDFIEIGEEMLRDTASGKLEKLEQKIPQQAYDSYEPQVILKWAKARGLNIPTGFLKNNNGHFYSWFGELIRKTPDLQMKREELVQKYDAAFKGDESIEQITIKSQNFINAWKELAPASWSKGGRRPNKSKN